MKVSINNAPVQFLLASTLGLFALLAPIPHDGQVMVPLGIVSEWVRTAMGEALPAFVVCLCVVSVAGPMILRWRDPSKLLVGDIVALFRPSVLWYFARFAGLILATMILFGFGPLWLVGDQLGGEVMAIIVSAVVTIMLGCLILPFLTDFGLMEYIGTYVERWFRKVFTVPGRGAVDAVASWLGGSAVGLMVTANQMRSGFYTPREAAVVATNFSIVSIAFSLVIVEAIGLLKHFYLFYATLILGGVICAIIMPRIPPLSRKSDQHLVTPPEEPATETQASIHRRAWEAAVNRAHKIATPPVMIKRIVSNILEIWIGVVPVTLSIATLALVIAQLTPFVEWLSYPLAVAMSWFQIEDGSTMASALVISFADNLLPALLAGDIHSEATRFVIAVVSVGQLIFMSETGIVIIKLGFPIKFHDLVSIFILRTIILLPITASVAYVAF